MKGWSYTFAATKDEHGEMVVLAHGYFNRAMSTVAPGEVFDLTIAEHVEKRTNAQNRMMWGTCYDQLLEGLITAGHYEPHERAEAKALIHEGLCAKYQGMVKDKVTGVEVRKFRSSKATKAEFSAYIEWAARFAATEYGVVITLPGENV